MGGGGPTEDQSIRDWELKMSFMVYMADHPELRFWQALRNWSNHNFIIVSDTSDITKADDLLKGAKAEDTFYWENRK